MKTHYDPAADALYVGFSEGRIVESEEIRPGIILDFDERGKIVAMEILDVTKQMPEDVRASLIAAE